VSDKQVFRSPVALVVWWVWVLFAVGNLVDLAVQGRDHLALVAAFILLFVTGIVYVTGLRPRLIADADGLTIVNPVTEHRIGWAAVAGADATDLLRVRCAWPDGDSTRQRAFYAWAVHSSRRKQVAAEMRGQRLARRASGGSGGFGRAGGFGGVGGFGVGGFGGAGGFGLGPGSDPAPEADPLRVDADKAVATLTERAERARLEAPDVPAAAPAFAWDWPAVAAVVVPGLALLVVALT
jgi:uncharacterized membrane protein YgcG